MGKFWLVVAGTGRCGTKFMSEVLKSAGVHCTHQQFFTASHEQSYMTREGMADKLVAWRTNEWAQNAESSWLAAPFLSLPQMEGLKVVHLVRHPKKVINSLVKCQVFESLKRYGNFYNFAYQYCQGMEFQQTPKERAAYFYVVWNSMIEPWADIRWMVERDARMLLDKLGIEHDDNIFNNTSYNQRTGPRVDTKLDDLNPPLRAAVERISERYGYEWY